MRLFSLAVLLMSLVSTTGSLVAQPPRPGSVLIFPVHRSGGGLFTLLSVTNTADLPTTPFSSGGTTLARFECVSTIPNSANPFRPLGCTVQDRLELLTPGDIFTVLTSCHLATVAGGQSGYLVVSAQNPAGGGAWSHNFLLGSAFVVSASGVAWSVNAVSFPSPQAAGAPTDVSPANGRLDFNGVEYAEIPDLLYIDSFVGLAGAQLALINLTGGPLDVNTVIFSVWNDNEFALSTTLSFNCWFDRPLSEISTLFTEGFLQGSPNDPEEVDVDCDGVQDLESGWAVIDSLLVATPGGTFVAGDGALLGAITAGQTVFLDGGRLLWGSAAGQTNGSF